MSAIHIFKIVFLFGNILAPIICIIIFALRKNKFWFNYFALIGEIAYFIYLFFHLMHYPGQRELGIIGSICLLVAFIGTLIAVNKEKIPSSTKLGVVLCLYALMFLSLSRYIFQEHNPTPFKEEMKNEISPADQRFRDSILKAYPADTTHR